MTKKLFLIIFSFSLLFSCHQPSQENNYKNGKKDGLWKERYPNGNIKSIANYKEGKYFGLHRWYYSNGKINFQEYYNVEGKSDSLFQLWFDNGVLSQQGFMKNGKMNGEWFYFSEKGDTTKIENYRNDTLLTSINK